MGRPCIRVWGPRRRVRSAALPREALTSHRGASDEWEMAHVLSVALSLVLLAAGVALGEPASAGGIGEDRDTARTVRKSRTGPELSDLDEEKPVEYESSWDEYNRERAEYYRVQREAEERKHRTGGSGSCIYGADGSVIYAPEGQQCGPAKPAQ